MSQHLRAGVACVNITPPVGVDLTGFGGRAGPCTGVHDDLYARALVLDDGSQRIGIVTTDLLSLDRTLVDRIRSMANDAAGIQPHALMLNSSHTHSGPASIYLRGLGCMDPPYCDCLARKIVGALRMAVDDLSDASLFEGSADVQVGINRRHRTSDGGMVLGENPQGAVCRDVQVLRVDDVTTGAKAVLFTHAAHPVVLGGDNLLVSADFVGYATDGVEKLFGEGVTALFAQGCCGNINARDRGSFEAAGHLGRMLAGAAVCAAERAEPTASTPLGAAATKLQLPYMPPPSLEQARADLDAARRSLAGIEGKDVNRGSRRVSEGIVAWAEDMLRVAQGTSDDKTAAFEVQALRIGDAAVVALEGEVFVEFAHNIRSASSFPMTLVLAYSNGCIGYVPTASAYADGGYEVAMAHKYYGTQMIAPESEGLILAEADRLLTSLRS